MTKWTVHSILRDERETDDNHRDDLPIFVMDELLLDWEETRDDPPTIQIEWVEWLS